MRDLDCKPGKKQKPGMLDSYFPKTESSVSLNLGEL